MRRRNQKRRGRRSSKRKSSVEQTATTQAQIATSAPNTMQQKLTPVPSALKRSRFRRLPLMMAIICLVALAVFWMSDRKEKPRFGIIEYSSDDPNAQVVLEKDGQETVLDRGKAYSKQLEPGSYKLRLEASAGGLKLTPKSLNLDAGGRAFVTVRRDPKSPH
jgi:hypothetical protein